MGMHRIVKFPRAVGQRVDDSQSEAIQCHNQNHQNPNVPPCPSRINLRRAISARTCRRDASSHRTMNRVRPAAPRAHHHNTRQNPNCAAPARSTARPLMAAKEAHSTICWSGEFRRVLRCAALPRVVEPKLAAMNLLVA